MLVQSTAAPILTAVTESNIVPLYGGYDRPNCFEVMFIQGLVLPLVSVTGQEHEMWSGIAEFVGDQIVGVANFTDLKARGVNIASISSLVLQSTIPICL